MRVLAGNITFFDEKLDGKHEAHVHHHEEIHLPDNYDVELLLENFDAYLIPSEYTGNIIFDNQEDCHNSNEY